MNSSLIAIEAKQLGKCYQIYDRPQDRLKQLFAHKGKNYFREFWALRDVSFTLHQGESLGIIGRNGSGKSTLLQILCKTLTPTEGQAIIHGRIAALLELGAGFNPEFSGRENIFLNGAILGINRREMLSRMDEILAFADIGDFIDQPVKTYSSGMYVRLAFSVQACIEPDILIVDEALSVGDIFFQQKCARRMQELRERGTTLIFVSHDMSIVRDLCQKVIYLRQGKLIHNGNSSDSIKLFLAEDSRSAQLSPQFKEHYTTEAHESLDNFKKNAYWLAPFTSAKPVKKAAKLIAISLVDENNTPTLQMQMAGKLKLRVLYQVFTEDPIEISLAIQNRYDHLIHSSGSYTHGFSPPKLKVGDYAIFEIDIVCMIEAGNYTFTVTLASTLHTPVNRGSIVDQSPKLGPFTITWNYDEDRAPWLGMFGLPTASRVISVSE